MQDVSFQRAIEIWKRLKTMRNLKTHRRPCSTALEHLKRFKIWSWKDAKGIAAWDREPARKRSAFNQLSKESTYCSRRINQKCRPQIRVFMVEELVHSIRSPRRCKPLAGGEWFAGICGFHMKAYFMQDFSIVYTATSGATRERSPT